MPPKESKLDIDLPSPSYTYTYSSNHKRKSQQINFLSCSRIQEEQTRVDSSGKKMKDVRAKLTKGTKAQDNYRNRRLPQL